MMAPKWKEMRNYETFANFHTDSSGTNWIKLKLILKNYFQLSHNKYYKCRIPQFNQILPTKWKIVIARTRNHVAVFLYCGMHQKVVKVSIAAVDGTIVSCNEAREVYPGSYFSAMDRTFIDDKLPRSGPPSIECKVLSSSTREDQTEPNTMMDFGDLNEAKSFYKNSTLSDFSILAFGTTFYVHKAVLQEHSLFFARLFETEPTRLTLSLTNLSCDEESFLSLIRYMYTGQVDQRALQSTDLYILADDYGVSGLKLRCSNCLIFTLSVSSVLETISFAKTHGDLTLKTSALIFAAKNIDRLLAMPEWESFYCKNQGEADFLLNFLTRMNLRKKRIKEMNDVSKRKLPLK